MALSLESVLNCLCSALMEELRIFWMKCKHNGFLLFCNDGVRVRMLTCELWPDQVVMLVSFADKIRRGLDL